MVQFVYVPVIFVLFFKLGGFKGGEIIFCGERWVGKILENIILFVYLREERFLRLSFRFAFRSMWVL